MGCPFLNHDNQECGKEVDLYYHPTYCQLHMTMKCMVCSQQANRACSSKILQVEVCGNLLCESHFHLPMKANQKKRIYDMQHGVKE